MVKIYYSDDAQNITVMIKILLSWSSEYYSDDAQNITVMLRILLSWLSEYYSDDALDITSTNLRYQEVGKREVSGKILCRDTHELVDDWRGNRRNVCWASRLYVSQNTRMFWARIDHKLDII